MEKLERLIGIEREGLPKKVLNLNVFARRTLTIIAGCMIASTAVIGYQKLAETCPGYIESAKEYIKYLFN